MFERHAWAFVWDDRQTDSKPVLSSSLRPEDDQRWDLFSEGRWIHFTVRRIDPQWSRGFVVTRRSAPTCRQWQSLLRSISVDAHIARLLTALARCSDIIVKRWTVQIGGSIWPQGHRHDQWKGHLLLTSFSGCQYLRRLYTVRCVRHLLASR